MKLKNATGLKQYPYNTTNPFMSDVVTHITSKKVRKAVGHTYQDVLNYETGELEKQKILVLGESKELDKQLYYKTYYDSIKSFFGLSKAALSIFDYIMRNIKKDNDKICLVVSDILDEVEISSATVYRGLAQLIEANIIAKTTFDACYYINPNIAFKGDRIAVVKQYFLKKEENSPNFVAL
jgi:hypothetical protein